MATSSQALARAGLINPTKPATYPVILGEDIRGNSGDSTTRTFTGIRYNFKPKHLTDKSTQRNSTLTAAGGDNGDDGDFDVTFRDNSGGRYVYAGTRVSRGSKYVLVFDSKNRQFILHRLDSLFIMNMTDTPTNHDTEALKKKHPYIDVDSKRPRPPRGAAQLVRRPTVKKSAGPLRPMQKPVARSTPKPTVLRSSQDIKKKDKRVTHSVADHEQDRETKAVKEVREKREAIIVKEARDNRDSSSAAHTPKPMAGNSGSSSSNNTSSSSSPNDTKDAALQKMRAAALAARPKESSKLSKETKLSPDSKPKDRGGDDYKSRSIDVKSIKDSTKTSPNATAKDNSRLKVPDPKARLPEKPRSDGKAARSVKDKDSKATKDTVASRAKDGASKSNAAKGTTKSVSSSGKSKATAPAAPLSLPMPQAPATAAPASKKKRRDWEEDEDEDEEDDGDIGLVIEYPGGPPQPARASNNSPSSGDSSQGRGNGASSSTPQLHMKTFDEFTKGANDLEDGEVKGGDGDLEEYWDPLEDEKKKLASAANGRADSSSKAAAAGDHDKDDDLEADLEAELEEELTKELLEEAARKKREAELEAELEAEFMAESESEISEEE